MMLATPACGRLPRQGRLKVVADAMKFVSGPRRALAR